MKDILKSIGYFTAIIFGLLLIYVILMAIGPNGKCIACTTKTISDTVESIYEGSVKDVVFSLKHKGSYYINRGLENGLDLDTLRKQMARRAVTISYASPSTHINQLEFEGRIIFSELNH